METYLQTLNTDELQKAKLIIGQFITSCSHTMRGPLKSITGLVNLLQNADHSKQDATLFLDLIASTINKMERTLDELEHFLENSKREVTWKPVDFRELVHMILQQYEDELVAKHVRVDIEVDQAVPFYSDRARLRIILSNVISNAVQFRDVNKKSQRIAIAVRTTMHNCTVSVTDNGIGIETENQSKIFELFFRATEISRGTGVGLYVVNEAIQKMGGSIHVDSIAGKGSTFLIMIPNASETLTYENSL
jgi:signal transduction histidine kinase